MTQFELLNLFVTAPGDLIFFTLLFVVSALSLAMTLSLPRSVDNRRAVQRYRLGLAVTLVASLVLWIIGSGLAQAIAPIDDLLPPLERAALIIIMLLMSWSLLTADHKTWSRTGNILTLVLLALIAGAYLFTGIQWPLATGSPNNGFNLSNFGTTWTFIGLILSLLGTLLTLLLYKDIHDALLKMLFFLALLLGYGSTLLLTIQLELSGDYAGPLRLASFIALAFIPFTLFRLQSRYLTQASAQQSMDATDKTSTEDNISAASLPAPAARPRYSGQSVQLLKLLGDVLENAEPLDLPQVIVSKVTQQIEVDVGALLRISDPNYADVDYTYNQIMGTSAAGSTALNLDNHPTLLNVLERKTQRALYPDRNRYELTDIYIHLDIDEHIGPAYFQPLTYQDDVIAVLFLGLPYTRRELTRDELEWLRSVGILASSLLALGYQALEVKKQAEDRAIEAVLSGVSPSRLQDEELVSTRAAMKEDLKLARQQIAQLSQQVIGLKAELDDERTRLAELIGNQRGDSTISQRIIAITSEQEQLRYERDELARQLQEAETALHGATAETDEAIYDEITEMLQREKALLEQEKQQLQQQLTEIRSQTEQSGLPDNIQTLLNRMIDEKAQLEDERSRYASKLDAISTQLQQMGLEDDIAGLSTLIADLYQERATLREQNADYERKLQALIAERDKLSEALQREKERDAQLRSLQEELTRVATDREAMLRQRDKMRATVNTLQRQAKQLRTERQQIAARMNYGHEAVSDGNMVGNNQDAELMVGLAQELRTPMTSISGYVSLLMAESAGILGEMQREFLQRVSTNITRLEAMIDTLVKVTEVSTDVYSLEPQTVNLIGLVEDAITNASIQFRQKRLSVALDLEDDMPTLAADYDALTQVIAQLINNAYLVSPPESEINVIADQRTMQLNSDDNTLTDCLYVAVHDKGGGIADEDIPRVFVRKYKADNPLIAGVGDTGVGLSIAQTLVEKHAGRLWVETEAGLGSIFQFIIPLTQTTED